MAEIIGYLKEDATHGEQIVLDTLSHTLPDSSSPQALSEERRLVRMAMTRARERLYLTCQVGWPEPLRCVLAHADCRS